MANKQILVIHRRHDYHAHVQGKPESWGSGSTPLEAVGNLIAQCSLFFEVEIIDCTGPRPRFATGDEAEAAGRAAWEDATR